MMPFAALKTLNADRGTARRTILHARSYRLERSKCHNGNMLRVSVQLCTPCVHRVRTYI